MLGLKVPPEATYATLVEYVVADEAARAAIEVHETHLRDGSLRAGIVHRFDRGARAATLPGL